MPLSTVLNRLDILVSSATASHRRFAWVFILSTTLYPQKYPPCAFFHSFHQHHFHGEVRPGHPALSYSPLQLLPHHILHLLYFLSYGKF